MFCFKIGRRGRFSLEAEILIAPLENIHLEFLRILNFGSVFYYLKLTQKKRLKYCECPVVEQKLVSTRSSFI